jgi:hypothetical protein
MLGVAVRLEQLLAKSEVKRDGAGARSSALAFIVVVPGWTESPMWGKLQASAYLRACWSISSEGIGRMCRSTTNRSISNDCLTDDTVFVQMQTLFSRLNTNAIQCLAAASHPSSDHGFCDGAQHQRQDRFRESPFDTAIFILQNKTAAKTWPASESIRMELLKAMAQGKPSAAGAEVY